MSVTTNAHSVDVLIAGAGLAGLMAANRAAQQGLRTLVLERGAEDIYPCNTRYSGGLLHIAMGDLAAPPAQVWQNLQKALGPDLNVDLAQTLVREAPRAVRVLKGLGVRFIVAGPDGLRRHSLAPPIVRRPGLHWRGRAGDVLLRTLERTLNDRGGRILRGVAAHELVMRGKPTRCTGLIAHTGNARVDITASAIILADGGFQSDHDLLRRYITSQPSALLQRNAGAGVGSGLRMAVAVGARLSGMQSFYGHVQHRDAFGNDRLWPYPVLDPVAVAGLVVDGLGNRFCDEATGGVHIANCIARLDDPLSASVVFDHAIWQGPGRDGLLPVNPSIIGAGGELLSASSLEALAAKIGVPCANLLRTVAQHNDGVASSLDSAARPAPPVASAHRKRWPIHQPPFHAFRVCAGITYTMGGVETDSRARVLGLDGQPIEGLLAAGATTGGLEGFGASGYTGGLSKAATFGMIAGEEAHRIVANLDSAGVASPAF